LQIEKLNGLTVFFDFSKQENNVLARRVDSRHTRKNKCNDNRLRSEN
jgi:hypothetical protein